MFGFNAPHRPGSSLVRSHGSGGSGGCGGDGCQGAAHLLGITGGASGGGGPEGGGYFGAWSEVLGALSVAAAKSRDGPCVPGGPYPRG